MRAAIGFKAHSGWAVLVSAATEGGELRVLDRRRIELTEEAEASWPGQPYHAAANLGPREAQDVVKRGIDTARQLAVEQMQAAVSRARQAGAELSACGIIAGEPMPDWSLEQILAVHFRMHKAEGALYREALVHAAGLCGLHTIEVQEKLLTRSAELALAMPADKLRKEVSLLGRALGAPWGRDQKDAVLAALIAVEQSQS